MSPASFENVRAKVSTSWDRVLSEGPAEGSLHSRVWKIFADLFFLAGSVKYSLKRQKSLCQTHRKFRASETLSVSHCLMQ